MTEVEQEAARICTQMFHSHQEPFCELAYTSASLFLRLKSWEMNLNRNQVQGTNRGNENKPHDER